MLKKHKVKGIVTMENVIEKIFKMNILDEKDL